jgi:hypothetical protein
MNKEEILSKYNKIKELYKSKGSNEDFVIVKFSKPVELIKRRAKEWCKKLIKEG